MKHALVFRRQRIQVKSIGMDGSERERVSESLSESLSDHCVGLNSASYALQQPLLERKT